MLNLKKKTLIKNLSGFGLLGVMALSACAPESQPNNPALRKTESSSTISPSNKPIEKKTLIQSELSMKMGETQTIKETPYHIKLESLISDSRCPIDVVCIQKGSAVFRLDIIKDKQKIETIEVSSEASAMIDGKYKIEIKLIEPALRASIKTEPSSYKVTFKVTESIEKELAEKLQFMLDQSLGEPQVKHPGIAMYIHSPKLGRWSGAAGLGNIENATPMKASDRFRAGSIMKPFVAVVVLQLVEEGLLSLDSKLTEVLPADIVSKVTHGDKITVQMLLNHSSGIAEFLDGEGVFSTIVSNPERVWKDTEWLDSAFNQEPFFAPGEGFKYSNTDYTLLGLVIEHISDKSWREEVRQRVVNKLRLNDTFLPEPGDITIPGEYAHGYLEMQGKLVDVTAFDPSMAGAAGGSALITTNADLSAFLTSVMQGQLFEKPETLQTMLQFIDAPDLNGGVGYGAGIRKFIWGDIEVIGHMGGTAGYRSFVVYLPEYEITLSSMQTYMDSMPLEMQSALEILIPEKSEMISKHKNEVIAYFADGKNRP